MFTATFVGLRLVLEFVSGADFWCKLMPAGRRATSARGVPATTDTHTHTLAQTRPFHGRLIRKMLCISSCCLEPVVSLSLALSRSPSLSLALFRSFSSSLGLSRFLSLSVRRHPACGDCCASIAYGLPGLLCALHPSAEHRLIFRFCLGATEPSAAHCFAWWHGLVENWCSFMCFLQYALLGLANILQP